MMVMIGTHPIALATNHTVSINPNVISERTKDDGDGPIGEVDGYTWSMTADSIVGTNNGVERGAEVSIAAVLGTMIQLYSVTVVSDAATPETGSVPSTGWTPAKNQSFPSMSGVAHIESVSVSAGSSGHATASVTFRGKGELS